MFRPFALLSAIALFTSSSFAAKVIDEKGLVFGIAPGVYEADGKLKSESMWVPNADFHSTRSLKSGVIEAETKAFILGFEVAAATARLKVVPTTGNNFDLLDLNSRDAKAGSGACEDRGCTFTATVMNGTLTLTETWVPTPGGFKITECSQTYNGMDAKYEAAFKQVTGPVAFPAADSEREAAQVYLPSQYTRDQNWPVIVLLHGYLGSGPLIDYYFGLSEQTSKRGFILVVPNGLKNVRGARYWNASDGCCDFEHRGSDDVAYIRDLLDQVKATFSVDNTRIFVAGHSNGGFMAHRLACELPGTFKGIVSLAGVAAADAKLCQTTTPVSVVQIHALDDDTIKFDGDSKGYEGLKAYPGAEFTVTGWAGRDGCTASPVEGPAYDLIVTIPGTDTRVKSWPDCRDGARVELWTIKKYESAVHNAHTPGLRSEFTKRILDFMLGSQVK